MDEASEAAKKTSVLIAGSSIGRLLARTLLPFLSRLTIRRKQAPPVLEIETQLSAVGELLRHARTVRPTGKPVARRFENVILGQDDSAARQQYDERIEEQECNSVQYGMGKRAIQEKKYELAERYLRPMAEQGHPEAAYWLALALEARSARMRDEGRFGVAKNLIAEAATWREEAEVEGAFDLPPSSDDSDGCGVATRLAATRATAVERPSQPSPHIPPPPGTVIIYP
jgi:hypothetical protein